MLAGVTADVEPLQSDPCTVYATTQFTSIAKARLCDERISAQAGPLIGSATGYRAVADTILDYMTAYSFRDIAVDSGAPYNIKTDILQSITDLKTRAESFNFRTFHDAATTAFMGLRDAHTLFIKPSCLATTVLLPITLSSRLNAAGAQEVFVDTVIAGLDTVYTDTVAAVPTGWTGWSSHLGAVVEAIDGVATLDYLEARPGFISKDAGARLNWQLQNAFLIPGQVFPIPEKDTVTLRLLDSGSGQRNEITVEWMALFSPGRATSTNAIVSILCLSSPSGRRARPAADADTRRAPGADGEPILPRTMYPHIAKNSLQSVYETTRTALRDAVRGPSSAPSSTGEAPLRRGGAVEKERRSAAEKRSLGPFDDDGYTYRELYASGNAFASAYAVFDTRVSADVPVMCTLRVPSFSPAGLSSCEDTACQNTALSGAATDIAKAVDSLPENGCPRVAIDLTGNGGGVVCLAHMLMKQLVRGFTVDVEGRYDIIESKWAQAVIRAATEVRADSFGTSDYIDPSTGEGFSSVDAFIAGPTYTRGGRTSRYSKLSSIPCAGYDVLSPPRTFYPSSRLAVLADGLCGSACELVVRKLRSVAGVRVAGLGGRWGNDMDATSFAGGNVLSSSTLTSVFSTLEDLGALDRAEVPAPFATTADLSFNYRELYSYDDPSQLMEWRYAPADTRVAAWPPLDPLGDIATYPSLWPPVVASGVFAEDSILCEYGTSIPCDIAGQPRSYYRHCDAGILNDDRCLSSPPSTADLSSSGSGDIPFVPSSGSSSSNCSDNNESTRRVILTVFIFMLSVVVVGLAVMLYRSRKANRLLVVQGASAGPPPQMLSPVGNPPPTQYAYPHQNQNGGYPPQQQHQGYPPQQHQGYPPQQHQGYPPQQHQGYPPQQHQGYPPQQQQGYPPQQQQEAYPPH